eukprot:SAG31_NODE_26714_length_437_cov_3.571006_1_plen_23_part_10
MKVAGCLEVYRYESNISVVRTIR